MNATCTHFLSLKPPKYGAWQALLYLVLTGWLPGCATARQMQVTSEGTPVYQQLQLDCHFRRELNYQPILTADNQIKQTTGSADLENWNRGILEIISPNPGGNADQALLRVKYWKEDQPLIEAVRTRSARGWSSFPAKIKQVLSQADDPQEEAWLGGGTPPGEVTLYTRELVVPRYKIDFLLADLANSGFYEQQHRPVGAALITLDVDGGQIKKRWDLEPRLREMIAEVLQHQPQTKTQANSPAATGSENAGIQSSRQPSSLHAVETTGVDSSPAPGVPGTSETSVEDRLVKNPFSGTAE